MREKKAGVSNVKVAAKDAKGHDEVDDGWKRDVNSVRSRAVFTQPQANYAWWWTRPQFRALSETEHGCWVDVRR